MAEASEFPTPPVTPEAQPQGFQAPNPDANPNTSSNASWLSRLRSIVGRTEKHPLDEVALQEERRTMEGYDDPGSVPPPLYDQTAERPNS